MAAPDDRFPERRLRAANRRTAWTLAVIAFVFFTGTIASRQLGPQAGLAAVGLAMFAFVVFAIARHLRRKP